MTSMRLSKPPAKYDPHDEAVKRDEMRKADEENYKKGRDVVFRTGQRLIMPSPDGTLWVLSPADDGTPVFTAL